MPLQLIQTKDGSHSIAVRDAVTYHSVFGALQESRHIFIEAGLKPLLAAEPVTLRIFELGFGTGLNALLTLLETTGTGCGILYETVDISPLPMEMVPQLNYCTRLARPDLQPVFEAIHAATWEVAVEVTPAFTLLKKRTDAVNYRLSGEADLVFFDAFDPAEQPELWTEEVFRRLAARMAPGAVLVTYSSKGAVRRALQAVGLSVEKLPGPPGKREFLRASYAKL